MNRRPAVVVALIASFAIASLHCEAETIDLRNGRDVTAFRILGMLDEYLGRRTFEGSDLVESFYCNETKVAAAFRAELLRFAAEQRIEPRLREERTQGCIIRFRSPTLSRSIDSLYRFVPENGVRSRGPDGRYHQVMKATIATDRFRDASLEAKLAYLSGAYARYGESNRYRFANSLEKAAVVAQLLRDVGCRDVSVSSDRGRIPRTTIVRFQPTPQLQKRLTTEGERTSSSAP